MPPRLCRSDPSRPGIGRRRRGRGFSYVDPGGQLVQDAATLERIGALAIPPAWRDVWICAADNGHLQAVGTDDAGRRQYLYHPRWAELRSREKYSRMLDFARTLPDLRGRVDELLSADAEDAGVPTRERVLALAVRLLDRAYFRVGSEQYATEHGTHGLLTLRRTHVALAPPDAITFDFPAKHGIQWNRTIVDPDSFAVVRVLLRRRSGPEALLAWRATPRGAWNALAAEDVNAFLREQTGMECSAKDFRTWHGTVLSAVALASQEADVRARGKEPRASRRALEREVATAIKETATFLGNTPAVCRSSYVDPRVIDRYRDGRTIQPGIERLLRLDALDDVDVQAVVEAATLRLLEDRTPQTIARVAEQVIMEQLTAA